MKEIKRLKFNEPHKFKKKANEDQFKFNQKLSETLDSAKSAAENSQLEKVKTDLEEGEKLLSEGTETHSTDRQVGLRMDYSRRIQKAQFSR